MPQEVESGDRSSWSKLQINVLGTVSFRARNFIVMFFIIVMLRMFFGSLLIAFARREQTAF
jgi:hypothetical protein